MKNYLEKIFVWVLVGLFCLAGVFCVVFSFGFFFFCLFGWFGFGLGEFGGVLTKLCEICVRKKGHSHSSRKRHDSF